MRNTQILTVKLISRYICIDNTKYSIHRQNKFLNKFIRRGQSKRDPIEDIIKSHSYQSPESQLSMHTIRRMNVLNKVFMEYITDMMSTGEIEPEILNRDIEISHVKVTPDFKVINVYWIDHSTQKSNTEELLKKCSFQLRHELSRLRIIGNVPPVQFVKYKGIEIMKEVEQKLNALDFDTEHVSTPYPNDIHHTVTAKIPMNDEGIGNDENGSEESFSVSIPIMRHNVFGLNHYRIMSKIKASLNKSTKNLKIQAINIDSSCSSKLDAQNNPNFLTDKEEQEQFKKFLSQKRKERKLNKKKRQHKENNIIYDFEEQSDDESYDAFDDSYDDFYDGYNDDHFDKYIDEEFDKKQ
ncbi:unnamed protein product [Xylocopa violacea]|uniref:Ribosome-binding factor A n=1 Tax=Xylocopa violacea TaxID=135666 RepID=A0ABP1PFS2_XYLVO